MIRKNDDEEVTAVTSACPSPALAVAEDQFPQGEEQKKGKRKSTHDAGDKSAGVGASAKKKKSERRQVTF